MDVRPFGPKEIDGLLVPPGKATTGKFYIFVHY